MDISNMTAKMAEQVEQVIFWLSRMCGQIADFLKQESKKPRLHTALAVGLTFIISAYIVLRQNVFFNGDMAINGLIIQDIRHGHWFSWYFYGSNYYGNLGAILLTGLTLLTGISIKSIFFWEHFFYAVGIFFLILGIPKKSIWEIIVYPWIFFFSTRFFDNTYSLGFSLLLMVLAIFYYIFKNWDNSSKAQPLALPFFTGLVGVLALWHNPMYVIVIPIYIFIYAKRYFTKVEAISIKPVISFAVGAVLGAIPVVLAYLSKASLTDVKTAESASFVTKIIDSIQMYIVDFVFYFTDITRLPTLEQLFSFRTLVGFALFGITVTYLVLSFGYSKKLTIEYLFAGMLLGLLIVRGNPFAHAQGMYAVVRYGIAFYSFVYVIVLCTAKFALQDKEKKDLKGIFPSLRFSSQFFITTLLLISLSFAGTRYLAAYKGQHTYDAVVDKIQQEGVSRIYCENFYDLCAAVAFLGDDKGIDVQIVQSAYDFSSRNPSDAAKADEAVAQGQRVLSLIPAQSVSPEDKILAEYNDGGYKLVEGVYKKYLDIKK